MPFQLFGCDRIKVYSGTEPRALQIYKRIIGLSVANWRQQMGDGSAIPDIAGLKTLGSVKDASAISELMKTIEPTNLSNDLMTGVGSASGIWTEIKGMHSKDNRIKQFFIALNKALNDEGIDLEVIIFKWGLKRNHIKNSFWSKWILSNTHTNWGAMGTAWGSHVISLVPGNNIGTNRSGKKEMASVSGGSMRFISVLHEFGHAYQAAFRPRWTQYHELAKNALQNTLNDLLYENKNYDTINKKLNEIRMLVEQDNIGRHEIYWYKLKYNNYRKWYNQTAQTLLNDACRNKRIGWSGYDAWHKEAFTKAKAVSKAPVNDWNKYIFKTNWVNPDWSAAVYSGEQRCKWYVTKKRDYSSGRQFRPIPPSHLDEIFKATKVVLQTLGLDASKAKKLVWNRNYFAYDKNEFSAEVLKSREIELGKAPDDELTSMYQLATGYCGPKKINSGRPFGAVFFSKRRFGERPRPSNNPAARGLIIPSGPNVAQQIHAVVHESMHLHSFKYRGINKYKDGYQVLDEGITEFFARAICEILTGPDYKAEPEMILSGYAKPNGFGFMPVYEVPVMIACILAAKIGWDAVGRAYFLGQFGELETFPKFRWFLNRIDDLQLGNECYPSWSPVKDNDARNALELILREYKINYWNGLASEQDPMRPSMQAVYSNRYFKHPIL
jgi:hypothetical protein